MSYSDPQSLTISGTAVSLPRTSSGTNAGAFTSSDGLVQLSVSSAYGKRTRRTLRVAHSKVSSDPIIPNQNVRSSMSTYIVVDTPVNGYTAAEIKGVVDALVAFLTATAGSKVTQLLGGEN